MIGSKKVVGLIPARGGSKGVPRKNIRDVAGKPLIAWTIEAARASRYIDRVVLSSEDAEIIEVAKNWGCDAPFVRPQEFATDQADSMQVVKHALAALPERYDYLVLLQPTSPMRLAEDIDATIERCIASGAGLCVSVCEPDKSPYWMLKPDGAGRAHTLFPTDRIPGRRQDAAPVVSVNGAVYVLSADHIASSGTFFAQGMAVHEMPKERSFDIDTELDLKIVNFLLSQGQR
jgi:CMP-N,N'-diacetyllegionaminic acid synthase